MSAVNVSQVQPTPSAVSALADAAENGTARTYRLDIQRRVEPNDINVLHMTHYVPSSPARRTRWPKR